MRPVFLRLMMVICLLMQIGCASLLPKGKNVTESPWSDYADAKRAFDAITVGRTTVEELKQLGFDVKASPNLKILSYLDVASSVQPIPIPELDPGLQACIRARSDCHAYIFEPTRIYSKRIGNFWLDLFNFRRKTHQTGWRFKALIVFVNHTVAYKLASGEPQVDTMEDKINPLGPIQAPAGLLSHLVPSL
jgi:hypothetical protein